MVIGDKAEDASRQSMIMHGGSPALPVDWLCGTLMTLGILLLLGHSWLRSCAAEPHLDQSPS